jgi:hypothetical protein
MVDKKNSLSSYFSLHILFFLTSSNNLIHTQRNASYRRQLGPSTFFMKRYAPCSTYVCALRAEAEARGESQARA